VQLSPQARRRRGEYAELLFMARAAALGFIVAKPTNAYAPYDVVIEKRGRVALVQVKSVFTPLPRGAFQAHTFINSRSLRNPRKTRPYRRCEADFIAVWLIPVDAWYIIPIHVAKKLCIYFRPDDPKHPMEKFREAWGLLDSPIPNRRRRRNSR
jgi:hypothetical protein